jgi:hypothetical protein
LVPHLKAVDYITAFELDGPHEFKFVSRFDLSFKRYFTPVRFEVYIDGEPVIKEWVGTFTFGTDRYAFDVGRHRLEILWRVRQITGSLDFVILSDGLRMLAWYGRDKAIQHMQSRLPPVAAPAKITRLELRDDIVEATNTEEFAREEYPLDNSFGSETLSTTQEITRSLTTELIVGEVVELTAKVGAKVLSIIEAEIGSKISSSVSEKIGETITRRHQIVCQVKPQSKVVYTVIWKKRVRLGPYTVHVDDASYCVNYQASFGLTFEIGSRQE